MFGLQKLPGQDLLNEELLERLGDGNVEPADEQHARSCCLRSAQGSDVTPPHCASEGKQQASYKLRSDNNYVKKVVSDHVQPFLEVV